MRGRLRRLERISEGHVVVIPQVDGTVRRFAEHVLTDAFKNLMERMGAGEDAPPEHPLIEAVRSSSDQKWFGTFYNLDDPDG